jgi:DNA-binding NarL/FixJ family response regulator
MLKLMARPKGYRMRILLADAQSKVRFALRVLLERQPGMHIVGEVVNAESLLAQAKTLPCDLVLLSWELPGLAAVGSLSALRLIRPDLPVIALSGWPEARRASLDAGADAFVSKGDPPEQLLAAINSFDPNGTGKAKHPRPNLCQQKVLPSDP